LRREITTTAMITMTTASSATPPNGTALPLVAAAIDPASMTIPVS
jgi:hypothetical protein